MGTKDRRQIRANAMRGIGFLVLSGLALLAFSLAGSSLSSFRQVEKESENQQRENDEQEPAEKTPFERESKAYVTIRIEKEPEDTSEKETQQDLPVNQKVQEPKSPVPQQVDFTPSVLTSGQSLVEQGQKAGSFPALSADYHSYLGLNTYLEEMQALGARFFVLNARTVTLIGEIDFIQGRLIEAKNLVGLSPRSREITSEKKLLDFLQQAEQEYGKGDYQIILLVPAAQEAYLLGGIEQGVRSMGHSVMDFSSFRGTYKKEEASLLLKISSGMLKTGEHKELDITLRMGNAS